MGPAQGPTGPDPGASVLRPYPPAALGPASRLAMAPAHPAICSAARSGPCGPWAVWHDARRTRRDCARRATGRTLS
eukprot:555135-Prymnesium_polylepis.3